MVSAGSPQSTALHRSTLRAGCMRACLLGLQRLAAGWRCAIALVLRTHTHTHTRTFTTHILFQGEPPAGQAREPAHLRGTCWHGRGRRKGAWSLAEFMQHCSNCVAWQGVHGQGALHAGLHSPSNWNFPAVRSGPLHCSSTHIAPVMQPKLVTQVWTYRVFITDVLPRIK